VFGNGDTKSTLLKLDPSGRFRITVKSPPMTVTWATGNYKVRDSTIIFELIPGTLTVEGQILPNAIIAPLTLVHPYDVWIKQNAPKPSLADVLGDYVKIDKDSFRLSITRSVLTLRGGGHTCEYKYKISGRSLEIVEMVRPLDTGWFCQTWPFCDVILIDDTYLYTYSLLFPEWTGLWKKQKPGGG
jgi:hypothetical protein